VWGSLCTATHPTAADTLLLLVLFATQTRTDDLYGVLSVAATASQAEIKAAYRRLAHDLHPDKHHATKHTRQVRAPVCPSVHASGHSTVSSITVKACREAPTHPVQPPATATACVCVYVGCTAGGCHG
jgi:hypothetical protein